MRALLLGIAVLPACTLYNAGDGDDGVDAAIVPWVFDARPAPDANEVIDDCAQPLPCPSASAGRVTVCGRIHDLTTDAAITADFPTFGNCDLSNPSPTGPCQLAVRFYDALDFAGNPTGATPLIPMNYRQTDCGWFVAENVPRPSLGFLGIGVDDAEGAPDDHRLTGVAFPVTSGQVRNGQIVYAMDGEGDVAWTTQAGIGPATFADRGAILTLFTDADGTPVSGVRVISNGSQRPADDYYFSDTVPTSRTTIDPMQNTTGANGASLMLNSSLVEHSGVGGAPSGCTWSSSLAAAIPGVIFVQRTVLEDAATGGACEP